jgi:hypothetical protein
MSDINKLSERVIEYAERASAMSDAAQGKKRIRGSGTMQWLLLPAAGAGLYAVMRSRAFTRQAKDAVSEAKTRAAELPDDLLGLVRQSSSASSSSSSKTRASQNGSKRRSTTRAAGRRKTAARS